MNVKLYHREVYNSFIFTYKPGSKRVIKSGKRKSRKS